jgi:Mg2+-importing ATPase
MAKSQVIVRRLGSIENFGSIDVLCADKTGTLTEGRVRVHGALDAAGQPSERIRLLAVLNASFESGFPNPIDEALRREALPAAAAYAKVDEVPYDFIRKRLSVVVEQPGNAGAGHRHTMITKGALDNVLAVCDRVELPAEGHTEARLVPVAELTAPLKERFATWSAAGFRVLGIATKDVTGDPIINKDDEQEMTFVGFLLLEDPPKPDARAAIAELRALGVALKIITGDNRLAASRIGSQMGLDRPEVLTGGELHALADDALQARVASVDIFAETEPSQKERILTALRRTGRVVGYLGDGINDATALHVADVGISVDTAVDVARESADIILLRRDLAVLAQGVREGRITIANTLKYVSITTSANFGNMVSMAVASLALPFFPLLPKQILLNNFLSDVPSMAIATDRVDPDLVERPIRWNIRTIRGFMTRFGLVSSVFDLLTFVVLFRVVRAGAQEFQTGWFIESLMTELFIVLVIRSRRTFFRSRPSDLLLGATLAVAVLTILLPYTPAGPPFGLVPLPPVTLGLLLAITAAYLVASEVVKRSFYRRLA